ncbi:MAG: heparinase II/III family protein [Bacteroidota bacterium]
MSDQLLARDDWEPYPAYKNREAWEGLSEAIQRQYVQAAEADLAEPWEILPATVFMEYAENGNRSNYQALRNNRRSALKNWVLAECMEGQGRFMDAIINGVWAICEESYWGVPAHLYLQSQGIGLPDVEEPTVDLFAAETSSLLSWTYYLLGDQLNQMSPMINERIHTEIDRRILEPLQHRDDFWWMGFNRDRHVNNWNPWIISNWLTTVLLVEENPVRRARHTHKALRSLDNFLNDYPDDGGCDEGPGYWNRAGASVYDCLELLNTASDGEIYFYDVPLIQKMGSYIYKVFIDEPYYVNFADASAKINLDGSLTYQYGKRINDKMMMQLGAAKVQQIDVENELLTNDRNMFRQLNALFSYEEISKSNGKFPYVRDAWFPDLQVMVARSEAGTPDGFYLAAKGGHNAESHNHNDVGSFILYLNGEPAIVDVGVEEYTKKTFSSERYTIWTMQSAYHNLPTVNGEMQNPGRAYEAKNVYYDSDDQQATFALNIEQAYPEEAKMQQWRRRLQLNRDEELSLVDSFRVEEVNGEFFQTFMTAYTVDKNNPGELRLKSRNSSESILVEYDSEQFRLETEDIAITDERLKQVWDHPLIRLKFIATDPQTEDNWTFRFVR